jgi:hypothetical protein
MSSVVLAAVPVTLARGSERLAFVCDDATCYLQLHTVDIRKNRNLAFFGSE